MYFSLRRILYIFMPISLLLFSTISLSSAEVLNGEGLFWKIEKDGRKPSYLLGTMHVPDKRVLKIMDEVEPYLTKAKIAYFEIEPNYREWRETINIKLRDDDRTVDEFLPEEVYKKVVEISKGRELKEDDLKLLELWVVYEIVRALPYDEENSKEVRKDRRLDTQLREMALEKNVKVKGLEGTRERSNLLHDLNQDIFIDAIIRIVNEPRPTKTAEEHLEEGILIYVARDTGAFYERMEEELKGEPAEIYEIEKTRMLDIRNLNMVNGMTKGLIKGNSFTAVGAAHLPGEQGIVNILTDRGYTVTRMD